MNEDFVTSDLAKKLKEKGFKEECLCHYISNDIVYNIESPISNYQMWFCHNKYDNIWHRDNIDAPTTSQVLKWLREEKCIDITILPVFVDYYKREYKVKIYATCFGEPYDSEYFHSYEKAELFAINYVIDNLI